MIGSSFGHYRIEAQLGAGGMGVVYRAYDSKLRRRVAIKFLNGAPDDESRARVLQEARAASALNHPSICTIHEVAEADGQTCIVMEHVQGAQLEKLIVPGGLPSDTFFRYSLQIADALMHAHDRGIVHRDLKSANVIVGPEGRLKVLDFGLAHRLPEYESDNATQSVTLLAQPETVAGTLAYIAPEVFKTGKSDPRSDVWSLGVLFYEMASGRLPFKGLKGLELVTAIMDQQPVPQLSVRVSAAQRAIIHRCLEKDPDRRFQTSREVFAALEGAQATPTWRSSERVGIAVAAILVLGIGAGIAFRRLVPRGIEPLHIDATGACCGQHPARRGRAGVQEPVGTTCRRLDVYRPGRDADNGACRRRAASDDPGRERRSHEERPRSRRRRHLRLGHSRSHQRQPRQRHRGVRLICHGRRDDPLRRSDAGHGCR